MSVDLITTNQPPAPEDNLQEAGVQQQTQYRLDMLPLADQRFIEADVPTDIIQAVMTHLLPAEAIFALFQFASPYQFATASDDTVSLPFWVMITGTRLLCLAVSEQGITYQDIFDQHTLVEYQSGLARDELRIAQKTVTTGMWESKRKFYKEALTLFSLPEYEKYLSLAEATLKEEQFAQAVPLLQASLQSEPTIKGYLLLVHVFSRQGDSDRALDMLQQACVFADPDAVLQELLRLFPENLVLLLYLAIIYENNSWWERGIPLYQILLQKTPDFDLYFLKLAEMYEHTRDDQAAIEYYQKFITLRTESGKSDDSSGLINWNLDEITCFSADPDLVKAYFALARIHEERFHDWSGALMLYLALIRRAPFYTPAYASCWRMYCHVYAQPTAAAQTLPFNANLFWQAYHVLDPQGCAALQIAEAITNPPQPKDYRPLDEHDHDQVTHPGEREYLRRIQNWLMNLVVKENDAQGIEQYCEQVTHSNYPLLSQTIERMSRFLCIDMPRSFISRGKIGVSVKNREHPFIFIGSEHLTEGNDRYFSERELLFIIAAQAEHIKSGHLLMTETELWQNLGSVSFDGFLMALQCLPAGGFLSRITHRFATEGLKRVYKMTKHARLQKIFRFLEKRGSGRDAAESLEDQEPTDHELKNGRASSSPSETDLLLKDQIVDFARHAVYTADRVGLLACRDLEAACSAMFKLASDDYGTLRQASQEGLLVVFQRRKKQQEVVYLEYAKRLSELFKFALSEDYQRLYEKTVSRNDPTT